MPTHTSVLTRRRYLRAEIAHHEAYYGQFVTEQTLRTVQSAFSIERLREAFAENRHLDSIPQQQWDAVTLHQVDNTRFIGRLPLNRARIVAAGDTVTRSMLTCIAKRAARILIEPQTNTHALQMV